MIKNSDSLAMKLHNSKVPFFDRRWRSPRKKLAESLVKQQIGQETIFARYLQGGVNLQRQKVQKILGGIMYQNNQPQGDLLTVLTYLFPGANALRISLMQRQVKSKADYFCFLTILPEHQSDSMATNPNSWNNKIAIKCEPHRMLALGNAVNGVATGNGNAIGPFQILSDPSKSKYSSNIGNFEKKSLSIVEHDQNNIKYISLLFSAGQNRKFHYTMDVAMALSFADICKLFGQKCLELLFNNVPPINNYHILNETNNYSEPNFDELLTQNHKIIF